jgi:hypothetical protein
MIQFFNKMGLEVMLFFMKFLVYFQIMFLFSKLWSLWVSDYAQEDLAKFDYM